MSRVDQLAASIQAVHTGREQRRQNVKQATCCIGAMKTPGTSRVDGGVFLRLAVDGLDGDPGN